MDTTRELPPTSGKVFTRGIPSARPRLRPSDCGPVRFWSWLVLTAGGIALNLFEGSPLPEFGVGVLFAGSLFAPPLSEFRRTVQPRNYPSILGFVLLAPASLMALTVLNSSRVEISHVVPDSLVQAFKAALLALWVCVALREVLRFRRLRWTAAD